MIRYHLYKESNIDEIGEIPIEWDVSKFKSILKERNEPNIVLDGDSLLSVSEYYGVDFRKNRISSSDTLVRASTLKGYKLCYQDDLVINYMLAWKGALGASPYNGIVSPSYAVFSTSDNVNVKYLHYLLRTDAYKTLFRRYSTGIIDSRLRLYPNTLLQLDCILPSKETQDQIANYIDKVDTMINQVVKSEKREIELLRELRTSIIIQVCTRGLNPTVDLKACNVSWIDSIPRHWRVDKLLRHARLESGHTPSKQHPEWWVESECTIPWLTTSDIHRFRHGEINEIGDTEEHISQVGMEHSSARLLPKGTVALSRTASVGFSIILGREMATSQDFANWVPNEGLDSHYLLYSLRSMTQVFDQLKMGTTHKTIYMPDIQKLVIPFPPLAEQREIAMYLDEKTKQIDEIIEAKRELVNKLQEYRKSLIYEAVTGKIKVPEVGAESQ